eukprot:7954901-Ditylum_brightwellii.AAC.1
MEDAAVALTSLTKGEVFFEKKAHNVKKKAALAGSEVPKTKKKLNFDLDLNISECASDENSSFDNSSFDNSSVNNSSFKNRENGITKRKRGRKKEVRQVKGRKQEDAK